MDKLYSKIGDLCSWAVCRDVAEQDKVGIWLSGLWIGDLMAVTDETGWAALEFILCSDCLVFTVYFDCNVGTCLTQCCGKTLESLLEMWSTSVCTVFRLWCADLTESTLAVLALVHGNDGVLVLGTARSECSRIDAVLSIPRGFGSGNSARSNELTVWWILRNACSRCSSLGRVGKPSVFVSRPVCKYKPHSQTERCVAAKCHATTSIRTGFRIAKKKTENQIIIEKTCRKININFFVLLKKKIYAADVLLWYQIIDQPLEAIVSFFRNPCWGTVLQPYWLHAELGHNVVGADL